MKEEFEKLHRFLREEEAARLYALMEEKEEKSRKAAERVNRLNQVITSLEDKIRLTERELHSGGEGSEYLQVTSSNCVVFFLTVKKLPKNKKEFLSSQLFFTGIPRYNE